MNPNHTHFILVDDGRAGEYDGVELFMFRSELELQLKRLNKKKAFFNENIPLIFIAIEGDRITLKNIAQAIDNRNPVIILAVRLYFGFFLLQFATLRTEDSLFIQYL